MQSFDYKRSSLYNSLQISHFSDNISTSYDVCSHSKPIFPINSPQRLFYSPQTAPQSYINPNCSCAWNAVLGGEYKRGIGSIQCVCQHVVEYDVQFQQNGLNNGTMVGIPHQDSYRLKKFTALNTTSHNNNIFYTICKHYADFIQNQKSPFIFAKLFNQILPFYYEKSPQNTPNSTRGFYPPPSHTSNSTPTTDQNRIISLFPVDIVNRLAINTSLISLSKFSHILYATNPLPGLRYPLLSIPSVLTDVEKQYYSIVSTPIYNLNNAQKVPIQLRSLTAEFDHLRYILFNNNYLNFIPLETIQEIQSLLRYRFNHPILLLTALTHPQLSNRLPTRSDIDILYHNLRVTDKLSHFVPQIVNQSPNNHTPSNISPQPSQDSPEDRLLQMNQFLVMDYQLLEFTGDAVLDILFLSFFSQFWAKCTPNNLHFLKRTYVCKQTLSMVCLRSGFHDAVFIIMKSHEFLMSKNKPFNTTSQPRSVEIGSHSINNIEMDSVPFSTNSQTVVDQINGYIDQLSQDNDKNDDTMMDNGVEEGGGDDKPQTSPNGSNATRKKNLGIAITHKNQQLFNSNNPKDVAFIQSVDLIDFDNADSIITFAKSSVSTDGQLSFLLNHISSPMVLEKVSKGLNLSPRQDAPKVLSDLTEAVIGAVFVDSGYNMAAVWRVINVLFGPELKQVVEGFQLHPPSG
jgi:dsRNA-specific ribonuclease